jgi:hypothetical protein
MGDPGAALGSERNRKQEGGRQEIAALRAVLRDKGMSRGDRDILADDLERLRDFPRRHEYYGAR